MQNRVDPFGSIIETTARGAWMGNRGNIHSADRKIIRPFKLLAWITCALQFKGRRRRIMTPGHYTELFFLDEATAFAAGHRPCAECRRGDYNSFKQAWITGNPEFGFTMKTPIAEIDQILHSERMDRQARKKTVHETNSALPDGTFVVRNDLPYLYFKQNLFLWSASGYTGKLTPDPAGTSEILTPASIMNAFRAGYQPQINELILI